jgi:hypothetical protein
MMIPHKHNPMTRMLKRAARARREHGIALLFTLCILSMALVTAMIFSSNASTGRKVAGVYVDSSSAKILADGVVNRAILALLKSDNASSYVCSYYSANPPSGSANNYAFDWIWKLEKSGLFSFDDGPIRFSKNSYYDYLDSRCPSWEYVFTANGYGDATKRIYGRYAYVAIGQNDQLNPNALGKRNYNNNSPCGPLDQIKFRKRLGQWPCEPEFIFKSSRKRWEDSYANKISPEKIQKKYQNRSNENWPDVDLFFADILEEGSSGSGSSSDKQFKMMAEQYFDVSEQGEYNKFRTEYDSGKVADLTKHELADKDEHYRFPLLRTDWDKISVNDVKNAIPWFQGVSAPNNATAANPDQTIANLINYNAPFTRPPVTDNENWISGEPSYTGNKRTPYINEVYADVDIGGTLGLPRVDYILPPGGNAAAGFQFRVYHTDCTYSHKITLKVETVNMYPSSGRYGAQQSVVGDPIPIGEISYDYYVPNAALIDPNTRNIGNDRTLGSWTRETIRLDINTQWKVTRGEEGQRPGYMVYTFELTNPSVGSVTTPKLTFNDTPVGHSGEFYQFLRVRHVKLSLDRVVLRDSAGRNADLALMHTNLRNDDANTNNNFVPGNKPGERTTWAGSDKGVEVIDNGPRCYFDTQANDPRQNLRRIDWNTPVFKTEYNQLSASIGYDNQKYSVARDRDFEKHTDPACTGKESMSTAFIRHEPMDSLWELGAIHRGAPWQTINLKCAGAKTLKMGNYENGDGHLLDQIALAYHTDRQNDTLVGLINLNCVASFGGSSAPFTFKSLFTNFPLFRNYTAMVNGDEADTIKGDAVDSDDKGDLSADAYAKDLSDAVTYAISHGNYLRRTAVLPTTNSNTAGVMQKIIPANVPDAEAEEVFSRVVNLLKWNRQQVRRATVLVLAQTIKDVGGATLTKVLPKDESELMLDAGFRSYREDEAGYPTKLLGASVIKADTVRGLAENHAVSYAKYDNFFDEITGEAKIIVRLEWKESANNNSGAWIITRKEYVE